MEFVNYLIDNYMWLLIITGILIITVIGFIADNRSEKAKKKKLESQPIIKPEMKEEVKTVPDNNLNIVSEPIIEEKNLIEPNQESVIKEQPVVTPIVDNTPVMPADNINTIQDNVIPVNNTIEEVKPINIPFREDNINNVNPVISNEMPDVKPEVLDFDQMSNMVQNKPQEVINVPEDKPEIVELPKENVTEANDDILNSPVTEAVNEWDQFDNSNDPLGSTVNMTDFLSQIETPKVMSHQNGEEVKEDTNNDENDLWKL